MPQIALVSASHGDRRTTIATAVHSIQRRGDESPAFTTSRLNPSQETGGLAGTQQLR